MLTMFARVIAIVGALNWGYVGIGMLANKEWNLIYYIPYPLTPTMQAGIYVAVGASAVLALLSRPSR